MIWFFHPDLSVDNIELNQEESIHCAKVLRLRKGDSIALTDGNGHLATGRLLQVESGQTIVSIEKVEQTTAENPLSLHMAVAPTKNIDRFEWFLEKATETGITEITPVICDQSERSVIKPERLQKILIAAIKQSQRTFLPRLHPITHVKDFIVKKFADTEKYIAHCAEGTKSFLSELHTPGSKAIILIGPEGDFSSEEIRLASEKGYSAISLGNYRLRTETAAINACVEMNLLNRSIT